MIERIILIILIYLATFSNFYFYIQSLARLKGVFLHTSKSISVSLKKKIVRLIKLLFNEVYILYKSKKKNWKMPS